jgi:hypothetical protein
VFSEAEALLLERGLRRAAASMRWTKPSGWITHTYTNALTLPNHLLCNRNDL